ncbi:hypothetical protein JAAARDRAFT_205106 [Jaapia argillacea MUCL 33604]|uniref:Uncharacterized protein n=1 Tax=Jaapia argillacea MUCL 33604 TaxID=933084 RepID=A0A067PZ11_9AGAM|nr:hypothetical protein JAAARDRAFT_205106 [Jaapia argillacea MUCL 33604]
MSSPSFQGALSDSQMVSTISQRRTLITPDPAAQNPPEKFRLLSANVDRPSLLPISKVRKRASEISSKDVAAFFFALQQKLMEIRSEDIVRILTSRKAQIIAAGIFGLVLAPVIIHPVLGLIGFSAAGPVAGSLAALWQSSIGNVVAGSIFAMCQSIAAGGALPIIVPIASGAVSAGMYSAIRAIAPHTRKVLELTSKGFIAATLVKYWQISAERVAIGSNVAMRQGVAAGAGLPAAASAATDAVSTGVIHAGNTVRQWFKKAFKVKE